MSERLTDAAIREAQARAEPIAEGIATQDNAGTADPYFIVYEGNPDKSPKWWQFVSAFFTRERAEAFIERHRHDLRRPFVWVASAHSNAEIRAARRAFTDVPALAAEALARGEELAAADRSVERLAACVSNGDATIRQMDREITALRAEVERLTRERDEAVRVMHTDDVVNVRAEAAEAEVARLRAEAIPADAEERIKAELRDRDIRTVMGGAPDYDDDARAVLAAIRRQA